MRACDCGNSNLELIKPMKSFITTEGIKTDDAERTEFKGSNLQYYT